MRAGSVVLDRRQRDVLYKQLELSFGWVEDMTSPLGGGDVAQTLAANRRLWIEYADYERLLDDLGWDRLDPRETYPLTMPAARLARTMRRLHGSAAGELRDQSRFLREGRDPETTAEEWADFRAQGKRCADDDLDLMAVCEAVLTAMGAKPPRRRRSKALQA